LSEVGLSVLSQQSVALCHDVAVGLIEGGLLEAEEIVLQALLCQAFGPLLFLEEFNWNPMANMQQQSATVARASSGLSDWDIVSEGENSNESASSESSLVIFPGQGQQAASQSASTIAHSAVLNNSLLFGSDSDEESLHRSSATSDWQQQHQRLLSAVSDLASDPGLKSLNSEIYQEMPIEQRLLDQIAKLAEELDDSQEQAKLLLLQNDQLMTENEDLKKKIEEILNNVSSERHRGQSDKSSMGENVRVSFAIAAGLVLLGLAKKRLLFASPLVTGLAAMVGSFGFFHLLQNQESNEEKNENCT